MSLVQALSTMQVKLKCDLKQILGFRSIKVHFIW